MAVDDPPLECVGSNHVPFCEHLKPYSIKGDVVAAPPPHVLMEAILASPPPLEVVYPPGLIVRFEVRPVRIGRKRCSRCRLLRELFSLATYSEGRVVATGKALCLACAGLRRTR